MMALKLNPDHAKAEDGRQRCAEMAMQEQPAAAKIALELLNSQVKK